MPEPKPVDFTNTENAFTIKSDREIKKMALMFKMMGNKTLLRLGSAMALFAMKTNFPFAKRIIRKTLFEQFVGGTSLMDCQGTIDKLYQKKCLTLLDYGVEGKGTEAEFDATMEETMHALDFAASNTSVPGISTKLTGMARFALLEKVHEKAELTEAEQREWEAVRTRVERICRRASERQVSIMVDAEESWIQGGLDALVFPMMEKFNKEKPVVYNTYQLYLKGKLDELKQDYQTGRQKGYMIGAKLVRGAYMEKERERAKDHGYPSPVQDNKEDTDRDYDDAIRFCVEKYEDLAMVNASHNLNSNRLQAELITENRIHPNHPHLNFCQLYGMGDHITFNLAEAGFNVAKYVPYGPVREIVPYLIRRAAENSAVKSDMTREYQLIRKEVQRRGI